MLKNYILILLFSIFCTRINAEVITDNGFFDVNKDGKKDITYEYFNDLYYELVDTNFDGKVDQRNKYNNDDIITSQKIDQNFDEYFETEVFYQNGNALKERVDIDNDEEYELIFMYSFGVISKAYKYHDSEHGPNKISEVSYDFGYPIKEIISHTEMSKLEFLDMYWNFDALDEK